jgi:hypothetical protein
VTEAGPVPQRAVIVLPSTGEFDSRTYRIATTLLARGHEVTVLARWTNGLARDEVVPAGYRVVVGRDVGRGVLAAQQRVEQRPGQTAEGAARPRPVQHRDLELGCRQRA